MNNKLQSILAKYSTWTHPKKEVDEAIAAIKQAFLEMESMQDEVVEETWTRATRDEHLIKVGRSELRQAIRKEVNK